MAAMNDRLGRVMPRIIAVAGAALVVYQWAVARPLWLDEEQIALNIRERGLIALGAPLSLGQSAPYGWLAIQRIVLDLLGTGERALRLVPMLFGLGAIATALWIGRRWLHPVGASALVLLIAVGQWMSYSYVELKHYSADACFALFLPALVVWALETDRAAVWWIAATVAQFFGNGALFVTPACAALLVIATWRRRGVRAAVGAAAPGLVWLAAFAINYVIVLRPAETSAYLQRYWQSEFPPPNVGAIQWFGVRLGAFAAKPGGAPLGPLLWIAAVVGWAVARERRRMLGLAFALMPLSAFALATARFVPFYERLMLWVVPALYVGVALLVDDLARSPRSVERPGPVSPRLARVARMVVWVTGAMGCLACCAAVTWAGLDDLRARPKGSHHRLDDRSAVRWLRAREQPGDTWITTHLALPAIWWYASGDRPILEARPAEAPTECRADALAAAIPASSRAMVFLGFRFDDMPKDFDEVLLSALSEVGQITAYRGFGDVTRVAIVDRRQSSRRDRALPRSICVAVAPARRW